MNYNIETVGLYNTPIQPSCPRHPNPAVPRSCEVFCCEENSTKTIDIDLDELKDSALQYNLQYNYPKIE